MKHDAVCTRRPRSAGSLKCEEEKLFANMRAGEQISAKRSASMISAPRGSVLQRKCACGGSSNRTGECEECGKRKLQRRAAGTGPAVVPPIVHNVLRSPGQPLEPEARAYFEPRFGHDFSKVRVHTDHLAAESARAVNALAYTVNSQIVFDSGQFTPRSAAGRQLLAHELVHVVQQRGQAGMPQEIGAAHDHNEQEADRLASSIHQDQSHVAVAHSSGTRLMPKLRVLNASAPIPNPDGKGLKQTNAEAVEGYLKVMAQGISITVDRSSGKVSVPDSDCPGFAGGFMAGARAGWSIFKNIPLLNVVLGAPAALIGGLIGGIGGLFGSKASAAASSKTPTGSTCLCDILDSSQDWKIELNDEFPDKDFPRPVTLDHQKIVTFSPNSPKIAGAATMSGKLQNVDPWFLLAHELCGHAWLEVKNKPETTHEVAHQHFDASGNIVCDATDKNAPGPHGHEHAIERENLIRQEHGMEARGWRLKDPFCGESFLRDKASPGGTPQFDPKNRPDKLLKECQCLRDQLPETKTRKFRIDEAIP